MCGVFHKYHFQWLHWSDIWYPCNFVLSDSLVQPHPYWPSSSWLHPHQLFQVPALPSCSSARPPALPSLQTLQHTAPSGFFSSQYDPCEALRGLVCPLPQIWVHVANKWGLPHPSGLRCHKFRHLVLLRARHPSFTTRWVESERNRYTWLDDIINELDLIGIFRTFRSTTAGDEFFSSPHGSFPKTDSVLVFRTNHNKFKRI